MQLLGKTWISPENSLPQNLLGLVLAVPAILFFCVFIMLMIPFRRPRVISVSEAKKYLRDFLENQGAAFDWDDFVCIPIKDANLENIRQRAADIELPVNEDGKRVLRELLAELDQLDE